MPITLNQFVDKHLGKKADWDNFYSGQCVDLYRFYVHEVLGFPQSPGVGGAAEIWDSADPNYYDFINNGLYDVPQPGDIIVWNRNAGGGFGHVAVYLSGDVNSFTSFDQNWPTLSKCTKTKHNYNNIIGWLRPKKEDQSNCIPQEELDKMRTERDKNWGLYQEEKKIREEIYNELQGEKEKSKQLKAHLQQVASALGSPSDNIEDILSAIKINEDEAEKNRKTAKELEKAMDILKKENKDEKDDLRRQINDLKLINEKQAQHINTLEARLDNLEDKNETTKRIKLIIEKILNIFKKGK